MRGTSACKHEKSGDIPPNRKELQSYLKRHGIRAVGSTQALRAAYEAHQSGWGTSEVTASLVARSVSSPNQKKPAAAAKPSPEKRIKPFRKKCSQQTRARIDRAKTQRLYLVRRGEKSEDLQCEFVVLGSTGNVYKVTIAQLPSCTCPDSQKGHHCKHILFVLLKVIGIDSDSPLVYQAALLSSELEQVFRCMENRRVGGSSVMANEQVRSSYAASLKGQGDNTTAANTSEESKRKTLEQNADCPICFDSLASGSLTFCRGTCGTNFHEDCIRRWLGQHRTDPTCPNCRQPWQSTNAAATPGSATKEGYANFGQLQGQSQERDTSTYSEWSPYSYGYKRRRYW